MSSVMPYESVAPFGAPLPAPDAAITPASPSMSDPAALGNSYLAQGMSQEEAISKVNASGDGTQKFAVSVDPKTGQFKNLSTPGIIPYDQVQPFTAPKKSKYVDDSVPESTLKIALDNTGGALKTAFVDPFTYSMDKQRAYDKYKAAGGLETKVAGVWTQAQVDAAKLIGAPVGKVGEAHDPILKTLPPEWRTPDQKQRDEDIAAGNTTEAPVEGLFNHSLISSGFDRLDNPDLAQTKTYNKINEVAGLQQLVSNPNGQDPNKVRAAQAVINFYKSEQGKSFLSKTGSAIGEMVSNPIALMNGFMADPELILAPEAKLGAAVYAARLAKAVEMGEKASALGKTAEGIAAASKAMPEVEAAAQGSATKFAAQKLAADQAAKGLARGQKIGNIAGATAAGAGINTGMAAEQQIDQQGYVSKGSLGPAAAIGGVLGGALGGAVEKSHAKGKPVPYEDVKPVPPGAGEAPGTMDYMKGVVGEPLPRMYPDGTGPGAPLHPDTPVNDANHVGYAGGVDATTPVAKPGEAPKPAGVIHYSKEMPATADLPTKDGGKVTVPIKETVAYHESVEYPLMHLEGPVSPEQLSLIHQRMGPHDAMPSAVETKLKAGDPLTYAEAHDIATRSENHHVEEQFNVDPKAYQDSFKPYIKKVAKANKTVDPSEIPATLDTKPYDNMGHTDEVMKGQGTTPEEIKGDSTGPQKSIIHKLAKAAGMDDPTYRAMLKKVAGVDSAKGLSKKTAAAVIKHLKDNKGALTVAGGLSALGAYENKDKKGGALGGAVTATFFALAARHPEIRAQADEMRKAGVSAADIQKQLGVFQGADKVWRGEFSDKDMTIDLMPLHEAAARGKTLPLMDVVQHDKFEKMFPNLSKDIKIKVKNGATVPGGFYDPATKTITVNSSSMFKGHTDPSMNTKEVILHEMMHAVQHREGLPNGASYEHFVTELQLEHETTLQRYKILEKVLARADQMGLKDRANEILPELRELHAKLTNDLTPQAIKDSAWEKYFHTSGEHEARAVVDRMHLSGDSLKGIPVEKTMGMPMHLQRVGDVFERNAGEVAASTSLDTPKNLDPSDTVKKNYNDFWERTLKRHLMENRGHEILDNMEEAKQSPAEVSDKFWKDTYWKLPGQAQDRFIKLLKGHTGDSVDWIKDNLREAVDNIDLPNEVQYLEGTDRGFTALMKEGNDRMTQLEKSQEAPKFLPKGQAGNADPELVKKLAYAAAFGTVGATLGLMYGDKDSPVSSAIKGAGLAMIGGPLIRDFVSHPIEASKSFGKLVKDSAMVVKGESVNDSISKWQASSAKTEVVLARINHAGKELNLSKQERLDIGKVMDGDKTVKLSPAAQKGFNLLRNFDDELGKIGIAHAVLKDLIADHLSHIWKKDAKLAAYLDNTGKQVTAGLSPTSAFAKLRSIKSIEEGKAKGLTPITEDPFEILNTYARSVLGAVRNKSLLSDLRRAKTSTGDSLIIPTGKAPSNFVTINHPQMRGISVHPAIASELRQVFYSYELGPAQAALDSLNMAMKRSTVSFSLFHLTSLGDAYLGGMPTFTHPINTLKGMVNSVLGKSEFHKALLSKSDPATQALFERSLESGTKYQIGQSNMVDADIGSGYYEGFKKLQDYLDQVVPHGGIAAKGGIALSHLADKVIFENGMSGMKFSLWLHTVDQLNRNFADLVKRKPGTAIPKQAEIDKTATSHVNNLMGAQDWIGAANQATTKFGRGWLRALGSPLGRRISQYAMFAPDWTTSTAMSFTKALGKGSEQFGKGPLGKVGEGLRGLAQPKSSADLARMYQIRSAALYALIGGTINYAYSGKYLWENKDPMTIDLGNGQRMQWNKHWLEPYEFIAHPGKTIANKMGMIPKEIINQLGKTEYWSPGERSPPMKENRITHVLHNFRPIPLQNMDQQTPESLFWNIAGRNVRGHRDLSPQERLQDLMERKSQIKKDRERKLQAQQKREQ